MIGVMANPGDYELVREFFELFKTPWEFYRPDGQYHVVLSAREDTRAPAVTANLAIFYAGQVTPFDEEEQIEIISQRNGGILSYKGSLLPIYGKYVTFRGKGVSLLEHENSQQSAGSLDKSGRKIWVRIGYDLFQEIRALLTDG